MQKALGLKVSGHVTITKLFSYGKREVVYDDHNLIVDGGLEALSNLIGQTIKTGANLQFTKVRIGSSNTAPDAAQTDIITPLASDSEQAFSSVTENIASTPGLTEFIAILGTGQGNGETLREVGLFTADDTMIARQIYGDISRTSSFSVEYKWRVSFAV